MALLLLALLVSSPLASAEDILRKIPITRCCPESEFYSLANGVCRADQILYRWPPPVYSTRFNRTLLAPELRPFELTERLDTCTGESGVFLSLNFRFYEDGTLLLPDGTRLKSGEFCISPVDVEDESLFLARYCAPDPCNATSCVRKCCPVGMAMNATVNKCQPSSIRFEIDFKDENGSPARPEPYVLRDGNTPQCADGMYALEPATNEPDEFYIVPDGRLYQPLSPPDDRYTSAYCVENFFTNSSYSVSFDRSDRPMSTDDEIPSIVEHERAGVLPAASGAT